jgi:hypothetical protein
MQHSWWNVVKPGGDNITQLVENQVVRHPHVDFETRPSSRLLQYAFVTIHRLRQALSAIHPLLNIDTALQNEQHLLTRC